MDSEILRIAEQLVGVEDRESLLKGIIAFSPISIQVYGVDGHSLFVNRAFEQLWGSVPPPEYCLFEDSIVIENGLMPLFKRAFAGEPVSIPPIWYDARTLTQLRIEVANRVGVEANLFPLKDSAGKVLYVVICTMNVTARMELAETEAKLRESQDVLRLAMAAGRMLTWKMDLATRVIEFTEPFGDEFAFNRAFHTIDDLAASVHADDRSQFSEALNKVLVLGEPVEIQFRVVLPTTEEEIWIETRCECFRDAKGRIHSVSGLTLDVTERKRIEAETIASRAQWRALVENAPDMIIDLSPGGIIRYINHTIPPYKVEDAIGASWLNFVDESDRSRVTEILRKVIETREPQLFETVSTNPLGEPRWYSSLLGPVVTNGIVTNIILQSRDITDAKSAEAHLVVTERMASVGALAAGVAHEVNNPIAAAIGNLEMALASLSLQELPSPQLEKLSGQLQTALEASRRVSTIVRDLKMFSRVHSDETEAIDVHAVLESTLRLAWNEIRHRANIVRDYGTVPFVLARESRLSQVFMNLVMNAAQAIPEGQADRNELRLRTRLEPDGKVAIDVIDTGEGITDSVLGRIFVPFFTTKTHKEGLGLGLSISRKLLSEQNGLLRVQSEVGKGSTFTVILEAAGRPIPAPHPQKTKLAPCGRRGRVFILDDEPILTELLKDAFFDEHDVVCANSGVEALALLRHEAPFDVILCDVMMPGMPGPTFHANLKILSPEQANRVVFMTGGVFTPHALDYVKSSGNPLLEKPFAMDEVRRLLHNWIVRGPGL